MTPSASPSPANRSRRWAILCGAVLFGIALVAMNGALIHCLTTLYPGVDFFQTPRAFDNLLAGNSMYLTELSSYGPYATPYLYHPFVAVAVGPWTTPFAPWTAFGVFIGASLVLLFISARLLASVFPTGGPKIFTYLVIFCTTPTFLMLWLAQSHVFLILAIALILSGLMRLDQDEEHGRRYGRWIQWGILISLLSKPVVIVMLPVLFIVPETRRRLLAPLAVYAAVSLVFLLVAPLNPGGFNGVHWLAILRSSASPVLVMDFAFPREFDLLGNYHVYSLPIFLGRVFGESAAAWGAKIPLAAILGMSFLPLAMRKRHERLRAAVVVVSMCVLSLYLCHYSVNEYYYSAMLPVLPALLWLRQNERVRWLRWTLTVAFAVLLVLFLPTPHIMGDVPRIRFWMVSTAERVLPALMAFVCLTVYGTAHAWLAVRRSETLLAEETYRPIDRTLSFGGALVAVLAVVFVTAMTTLPARLIKMPSMWTLQDWTEQLQYLEQCPGKLPPAVDGQLRAMWEVTRKFDPSLRTGGEGATGSGPKSAPKP